MQNQDIKPPRFAELLLGWLIKDSWGTPLGDFEEYHRHLVETEGLIRARWWYRGQVIRLLPDRLYEKTYWAIFMLKNYLLVALRVLRRQPGYSLLNLLGLSIGIACFAVIMLFVQDETSYDRFHQEEDRIYRLLDFRKVDGIGEESSSAPFPLAEAMRVDYPDQIDAVVRFFNFQAPSLTLAYQAPQGEVRQFNERRLFFVDPEIFEVFDFPLVRGSEEQALAGPNSIVLTEDMAEKYFGNEDPIGKVVRFEEQHEFLVTGVLANLPSNTHLKLDFLVSFSTLNNPAVLREGLINRWIWNPCWTYILLNEQTGPEALEAQFPAFVARHFPESRRDRVTLHLQPVTDIHLHSKLDYEMGPNSDIIYVHIFTTIALFILVISCINFVNLSTARSMRRAREVGVRKVLGGYKWQLVGQFLSESVLKSVLGLLLALPLIWLLLPLLNTMSGKEIGLNPIGNLDYLLALVILSLFIGILSGLYPALVLANFRPVKSLKGERYISRLPGAISRKVLVIGQFALSAVLIIGMFFTVKQTEYLQERRLGFTPEQVVLLPTLRTPLLNQYESFKSALLQHRNVHAVTTVEDIPGMRHQTGGYTPDEQMEEQQFPRLIVHDDFASTLGIEMASGREFTSEFPGDAENSIIINQAMLDALDMGSSQEVIGRSFDGETIVGVTENFHFTSLHRPIGPFVLQRVSDDPEALAFSGRYMAVRISSLGNMETISFIENLWMDYAPDKPFEYFFLDELLRTQYDSEATLSRVTGAFSLLSMFIACLGLFGLISHTVEQRKKEIVIRKVLGASTYYLAFLLSNDFVKLVCVATILSWPLAYFMLEYWLQDFAYRTSLTFWPFFLTSILVLSLAYLTIGYRALKTAFSNPIHSLRSE